MAEVKTATDWSNVPVRLGSALVIGAVVVAALWFGGWIWATLIAVGAGRMGFEWGRMFQPEIRADGNIHERTPQRWVFAVMLPVLVVYTLLSIKMGWDLRGLVIALAVIGALGALLSKATRWNAVGILYLGLPAIAAIWLRGFGQGFEDDGFQRVIFVLLIVVAADAGAYFAGKSIGGPKLAPQLSPNKTWAGFAGGLVLGALLGGVLAELMSDDFFDGVLVGAVLVVAAVAGDFLESGFKRHFGVKDTGAILPGHGGVLDRVDSHMAALTVAALVIALAPQLSPV